MSNYSKEFKEEALQLSDVLGVKKNFIAIWHNVLYAFRLAAKLIIRKDTSAMSDEELRMSNRELERENAELR